MSNSKSLPDIYLSFFMFTANMKPDDSKYQDVIVERIKKLKSFGYNGFEFPIAPPGDTPNFQKDLKDYTDLRRHLDSQGLKDVKIATNVGATPAFDPSSPDEKTREKALEYLKSRVDITEALNGEILMGPIVVAYADFPTTESKKLIWSDELQELLEIRYKTAQPVLDELGEYAAEKNVKLAIEPITHWETPSFNKLSQVIEFLKGVKSRQVGVVIDSAHEILDGDGPEIFQTQVMKLAEQNRLHYVQVSPPDRGALHTSWMPWNSFLKTILPAYDGPIAIEVFNAIPPFTDLMRLSRRKFWIPGEDQENPHPNAYEIADAGIKKTREEIKKVLGIS
ncbi:MAG: sugar phosphate isomerase/epimerase family protein [Limnoraphis robusta]